MDYTAAAPHAAAGPYATVDSQGHHPYGYPYPGAPYYQPGPAVDPSADAVSSASYYSSSTTAPADAALAYGQYVPCQYYGAPPTGYYYSGGEVYQTPAAPAATGTEAVKHFGFDPQRYAQAAAAKAPSGMAPVAAATGIHHAQWNAHFGHPVPKNVTRKKIMKKRPSVAQPSYCEVCKIQCDTQEVLMIHKAGKKHKKNLAKLQDSITPKPANAPNNVSGANTGTTATSDSAVPAVQTKKNKKSTSTPEDLEVKRRRVLDAGAARGEVKICTVCNVVANSQKVYEFHISGQKHVAMVQKQQQQQQAQQLHHVA